MKVLGLFFLKECYDVDYQSKIKWKNNNNGNSWFKKNPDKLKDYLFWNISVKIPSSEAKKTD